MQISFSNDAGETFDDLLRQIKGYTVRITPESGSECFDARLVGIEPNAEWHGTLRVKREGYEIETVAVSAVHVY